MFYVLGCLRLGTRLLSECVANKEEDVQGQTGRKRKEAPALVRQVKHLEKYRRQSRGVSLSDPKKMNGKIQGTTAERERRQAGPVSASSAAIS